MLGFFGARIGEEAKLRFRAADLVGCEAKQSDRTKRIGRPLIQYLQSGRPEKLCSVRRSIEDARARDGFETAVANLEANGAGAHAGASHARSDMFDLLEENLAQLIGVDAIGREGLFLAD